jgi:hypothetical protein
MTGRTKRLGIVAAVVVVCSASGVLVGHAVTNTAETKLDCIIVNGAVTGQTQCPQPTFFVATSDQVFNVAAGALVTACTFVDSALSPNYVTGQSLGPFHVQTLQFNNMSRSDPNAIADSAKSFGGGSSVTYGANTITDTTKASYPAIFVGLKIQSKFNTGTVASITNNISGSTLTLTANWSPSTPGAGDPYQVAPCTDNLGGTTQTVTINGWGETFVDQANDEGNAEGLGTSTCPNPLGPPPWPCDVVNIGVPLNGAVIYESPGQCVLTVNSSSNHTTKLQVDAGTDDNTTLTVSGTATGTDGASNIPVQVAAGGGLTCPGGGSLVNVTAFYTGTSASGLPSRDQ